MFSSTRYSPHWRIPVISPGGGFNYHFDNKREYQLLTRMLHSSKTIVHFISRVILPHFNWTSVRIIAERNVIESQVRNFVFNSLLVVYIVSLICSVNSIRASVTC